MEGGGGWGREGEREGCVRACVRMCVCSLFTYADDEDDEEDGHPPAVCVCVRMVRVCVFARAHTLSVTTQSHRVPCVLYLCTNIRLYSPPSAHACVKEREREQWNREREREWEREREMEMERERERGGR